MRQLICELLRDFYAKDWVTGTGGGICAVESAGRLLLAPTGVHKERVGPDDLFLVDVASGDVLERPDDATLVPSECGGVFRAIVQQRDAGSVIHTHALSAILAADEQPVVLRGFEMLKGIRGLGNDAVHHVPVVANTARESQLVAGVTEALAGHDDAWCVLVRDHGAYVWGADAWEAKRHAEVYHWLFDAARARGERA